MPHLSPMSWSLSPVLFFFILMVTQTTMWWNILPSPKFLTMNNTDLNIFPKWKWSNM